MTRSKDAGGRPIPEEMHVLPFDNDTPLLGDGAPDARQIDDLLRVLATIRHRFGNTAVRYSIQWGSQGCRAIDGQKREIERLQQWVADCQSGMYVNCVYCGHRYGPREETPTSMADVLKEHVEECKKHPMSKLRDLVERIDRIATSEDQVADDDTEAMGVIHRLIAEVRGG